MADAVRGLAGSLNYGRGASNEIRVGTVLSYDGDRALLDMAGQTMKATILDNVTVAVGNKVAVAMDRRRAIVTGTLGITQRSKPLITPESLTSENPLPPDYDPNYPDWHIAPYLSDFSPTLVRKWANGSTWSTVTGTGNTTVSTGDQFLLLYNNPIIANINLAGAYEFTEASVNIGLGSGTSVTATLWLHAYNDTNYPTSGAPTRISPDLLTGNSTWGYVPLDTARVGSHFQNGIGGIGLTITATSGSFPGLNFLPPNWGQIRIGYKEVIF